VISRQPVGEDAVVSSFHLPGEKRSPLLVTIMYDHLGLWRSVSHLGLQKEVFPLARAFQGLMLQHCLSFFDDLLVDPLRELLGQFVDKALHPLVGQEDYRGGATDQKQRGDCNCHRYYGDFPFHFSIPFEIM